MVFLSVQHKGYEINAALAQGVNWSIEDAKLYRKQLCLLKDAYLKDLQLKPLNPAYQICRRIQSCPYRTQANSWMWKWIKHGNL